MAWWLFILSGYLLYVEAVSFDNQRCSVCMHLSSSVYAKRTINCSNCQLQYVPIFPLTTVNIDLSFNRIVYIDNAAFAPYKALRKLNLRGNGITHVEKEWLNDAKELQELVISNNRISGQTLNNITFYSLINLAILHIDNNYYYHYPETNTSNLRNLQNLSIDIFENFKFGEWFKGKTKLRSLILYPREDFHIHNDSFNGIENSPIEYMTFGFRFYFHGPKGFNFLHPFRYLKGLSINIGISSNIRTALRCLYGLRNRQLEYLYMPLIGSDMEIDTALTERDIEHLLTICVKTVDLSDNGLVYFPFESIINTQFGNCLEKIILRERNFAWRFFRLISILSLPQIRHIDISKLRYSNNQRKILQRGFKIDRSNYYSKSMPNQRERDISELEYVSSLFPKCSNFTGFVSGTLQYIDISGWDLSASRQWDWTNVCQRTTIFIPNLRVLKVNNSKGKICAAPCVPKLVLNTKLRILHVSGSNCTNLNPQFLCSDTNLEEILLSNSYLGHGLKNTQNTDLIFRGLTYLHTLDISYNSIYEVPVNLFRDQKLSLQKLNLGGNLISRIPPAIKELKQLQFVDMSNNMLLYFAEDDQKIIENLNNTKFNFDGNRFDCTCNQVDSLVWMSEQKYKFIGTSSILCIKGQNISDILLNIRSFRLKCLSGFWLYFAVITTLLTIVSVIVLAAGYRNKSLVIYFYLKARRFLSRQKIQNDDASFEYDLFISYSHFDTEWVTNILYRYIVDNLNLKICVHDKDFRPGEYIGEEILRCIDVSKRSAFVITTHFLTSEWSNFEMEIARRHVFEKDNRNILIILKDPIPVDQMPNALKKIWWRVVCLEYPQTDDLMAMDIFWKKLKDSL